MAGRDSLNQSRPLGHILSRSHTAIQEKLDGKTVDWMEKVTDEQYQP